MGVPRSVLRTGLGLLLGWGIGLGCNLDVVSVFTCLEDQNCIDEGGEGGVCEPNNLCTFPDEACPSGKRWHDRAAELAGKCYDPADLGGGTGTDTVAGTGSGTEAGSSTSGSEGSTTLPADGSSSSGEPPPMTDSSDGGSSSGGMTQVCDDLFGAAPGYQLCEETPTTCSFNATLAMTSCDAMCMMFGATCSAAFTNTASDCPSMDAATTCDDATANDHICVCNKP